MAVLTFAPILLPLLAACVTSVLRGRWGARITLVVGVALMACAGLLGHELSHSGPWRHSVGGWRAPLGIDLLVDWPALTLLALTAVVGTGVSVHARSYFESAEEARDFFWPLWLALWGGLGVLALSSDVFTLYVAFELIGLSAIALVAQGKNAEAAPAAERYVFVSIVAALGYLLAVALLYAEYGVLDVQLLSQLVRPSPSTWLAFALATASLAAKAALLPLHGWLPPAHANAPAPTSAILSSLVVKAAFFALLRLASTVFVAIRTPLLDFALSAMGAAAVIAASVFAMRQERLKRVVAYSTVAQLGYLMLPFAFGPPSPDTLAGILTFAVAHGLAKAALFLAAGNVQVALGHDRIAGLQGAAAALPLSFGAMALAGMSLAGLPLSGGFVAKWKLIEVSIHQGHWAVVAVLLLGGLLAVAYLVRILGSALKEPQVPVTCRRIPLLMEIAPLGLAVSAVLLAFVPVSGAMGAFGEVVP